MEIEDDSGDEDSEVTNDKDAVEVNYFQQSYQRNIYKEILAIVAKPISERNLDLPCETYTHNYV